MSLITKIFGDPNAKVIKELAKTVEVINGLEKDIEKLSNEELKAKTPYFREQLKAGKTLDDILPEAFACVREAAKRTLGQRHFDVQLMGGIVLHQGEIAEMKTGEGKTLVATLAVYLNALEGRGVHVVTVNDYLASRDAVWMGQIYYFLGLAVGCIQHEAAFLYDPAYKSQIPNMKSGQQTTDNGQQTNNQNDQESERDETRDELGGFLVQKNYLRPVARKEAYAADVTYGTNNEFGFDYLKDNMVQDLDDAVQRELHYAIVDEIDSILIDEARTPLIISAPAEESTEMYYKFAELVTRLKENDPSSDSGSGDYNVDEKMRAATLTEEGINKMEKWLGVDNIYTESGIKTVHHIENALRAQTLFLRDRDYVVKEGEVIIVDEFTGRLMPGRRYSEGMHQAIEAKEGVKIQRESVTMATITFQNLFRIYKKLAGMTGTAVTEAEEFAKIYQLEVTVIPTNVPMIREDRPDSIYSTEKGKYGAIVREIKERHKKGQPVLLGTISIEKNEMISGLLAREGIDHQVLNAKHHEKEGEIIAQAGRLGAVTIATNMAGRGVDIKLGGNPPDLEEHQKVLELGGLHIIGTERHESRRIDNQLRGRSGRQGEPGSSQFFISMEDDLMRIFAGERMKSLMQRLHLPEDTPIENKMVSKAIESAQYKVEGHNFDIRKHLVEYDDVINKHREVIYKKRREILDLAKQLETIENRQQTLDIRHETIDNRQQTTDNRQQGLKELVFDYIENEIEQVVSFHTAAETPNKWNLEEIYEVVNSIFPVAKEVRKKIEEIEKTLEGKKSEAEAKTKIIDYLLDLARENYDVLEKQIIAGLGDELAMRKVEKGLMLRAIDTLWVEHLDAMDHLRTGIGLRGYGQRDPLIEYKKEAFKMFNELINLIQKQVVYSIYKIGLVRPEMAPAMMPRNMSFTAPAKVALDKSSTFDQMRLPQPGSDISREMAKQSHQRQADQVPAKVKDSSGQKVGRNDPCPCGAKKADGTPIKYKHCHGK